MKKAGNKNLKLIAFTGMTIFSLFSVFMATIAWFSMNRVVNGDGSIFQVETIPSMLKSITVYNQNASDTPYVFNSTMVAKYNVGMDGVTLDSGNPEKIALGTYQSLSDTPDSTLLYLFEIDSTLVGTNYEECSLHIKTDTPDSAASGANGTNGSLLYRDSSTRELAHKVTFDVSDANKTVLQTQSPALTDDYFGKNSMSSIMSWNVQTYNSALVASNGTFDLTAQFAGNNPTSTDHSFVSSKQEKYTVNGFEHTETVYYYSSYDETIFSREKNSNDTLPAYLAVVCHYNVTALQYIFNINLGNPATETNAEVGWEYIKFTCDWYFAIR